MGLAAAADVPGLGTEGTAETSDDRTGHLTAPRASNLAERLVPSSWRPMGQARGHKREREQDVEEPGTEEAVSPGVGFTLFFRTLGTPELTKLAVATASRPRDEAGDADERQRHTTRGFLRCWGAALDSIETWPEGTEQVARVGRPVLGTRGRGRADGWPRWRQPIRSTFRCMSTTCIHRCLPNRSPPALYLLLLLLTSPPVLVLCSRLSSLPTSPCPRRRQVDAHNTTQPHSGTFRRSQQEVLSKPYVSRARR